jgi:hypothetical protein
MQVSADLNALNQHIAQAITEAGRFVVEGVFIGQMHALRITLGNLRLLEEDIHLLCSQLAETLLRHAPPTDTGERKT